MAPDSGDAELHAVIAERVRAVRAKDVDGLLAAYAPDVATFNMASGEALLGLKP